MIDGVVDESARMGMDAEAMQQLCELSYGVPQSHSTNKLFSELKNKVLSIATT